MPIRVTCRRTKASVIAPERDDEGKPIVYAYQAWVAVRASVGSEGFADCSFTAVAAQAVRKPSGFTPRIVDSQPRPVGFEKSLGRRA